MMLSIVNNNQPTFHGMYIIKGNAKTVDKAYEMIKNRCGGEWEGLRESWAKSRGEKMTESFDGFNDFATLNLTDIFGEHQPQVHKLFATNEHKQNVINWNLTMRPPQPDPLSEKMQSLRILETPFGIVVRGDLPGIISGLQWKLRELGEKMAPYMEAEREALNGNMDKMSDFLIDAMKTVKQRLQEVRELSTVPYEEPKVLKAKEVIDAIRSNKFNFITGEIKG